MRASMFMLLVVALFVFVGSAGCGSSERDFCEGWTRCHDGNDEDEKACIALQQGFQNAAAAYGCSDEWDDWASCRADNSTCRGIGVAKTYSPSIDCDEEFKKYDDCQNGASDVS